MAIKKQCLLCQNVSLLSSGEINCKHFGFAPEIDNSPCPVFSKRQESVSAKKTCPECGTQYDIKLNACPKCGEPNNTSQTQSNHTDKRCPDCGKIVSPAMTSCPNCGCPMTTNHTNNTQYIHSRYVTDNLLPNERILCTAQWHWIDNVFKIILSIIAFLSVFGIAALVGNTHTTFKGLTFILLLLTSAILVLTGVLGLIDMKYKAFVVTNMRIIIKAGFFIRASYELRLEKLESIQVYQGLFGRILGYGSILVHGVGASRQIVMRLKSPFEFRHNIFSSLDKNKQEQNN